MGLQCPKLLWIKCHEKWLIPKPGESQQHLFDQGHEVGNLAKSLFPKGIEIETKPWEYTESDTLTRKEIEKKKPLFEAGFLVDGLYSRADVLMPAGKNMWDIIEVKSGTKVEEVHVQDAAFQRYVYEKAGLKIRKCFLMHINNEYVRKGKINIKQLFKKEDITKQVNEAIIGIEERIDKMLKIISSPKCLEVKIGPQCNDPYECALHDYCWKHIPLNSVFDMYRLGKKAFDLYDSGVINLKDIPDTFELNEKQLIQHNCTKCNKAHIHKEEIKNWLKQLKYPLYFMDFETYATAIPLYNKLKPYQNITFQFSVHIINKPGQKAKHFSFIADGLTDPRKEFIGQLRKVMGKSGSVIVYNQSFEQKRLEELATIFPKHKSWVKALTKRFIDLLIPFRSFWYYNPSQQGSASLKCVLPALTGKSYEGMEIAEGGMASRRFLYLSHGDAKGQHPSKEEAEKIRHDLEKYCGLDTEGMIFILEKLKKL